MNHLTNHQKWIICEHLINSVHEHEKIGKYPQTKKQIEKVLDLISPNWRDADRCIDVKFNDVTIVFAGEGKP